MCCTSSELGSASSYGHFTAAKKIGPNVIYFAGVCHESLAEYFSSVTKKQLPHGGKMDFCWLYGPEITDRMDMWGDKGKRM